MWRVTPSKLPSAAEVLAFWNCEDNDVLAAVDDSARFWFGVTRPPAPGFDGRRSPAGCRARGETTRAGSGDARLAGPGRFCR